MGHISIGLYPVVQQAFPHLQGIGKAGDGGEEIGDTLVLKYGHPRRIPPDPLHVDPLVEYGLHQGRVPLVKTLEEPVDNGPDLFPGSGLGMARVQGQRT